MLIILNKIEDAETIIDEAYGLFPKDPYVLNKKGVVLLSYNKPSAAQKYFVKALKLRFEEEFL